jgi:hypothetical protein
VCSKSVLHEPKLHEGKRTPPLRSNDIINSFSGTILDYPRLPCAEPFAAAIATGTIASALGWFTEGCATGVNCTHRCTVHSESTQYLSHTSRMLPFETNVPKVAPRPRLATQCACLATGTSPRKSPKSCDLVLLTS